MRTLLLLLSLLLTMAMPASAADVTLSWNANTESDLAGYKIYRSTISGRYGAPEATVGKVTTYTLTLPQLAVDTTYFFAITAVDLAGNESKMSNEVSKVVAALPPPPPVLAAPANFRYDAGTIRWDAVTGATGGYFLRVHEAGTPYDPCSAMTFCNETVGSLMATSKVLTLKPNTLYDMWVHAVAADGTVGESSGNSFTTPAAPVDLPPAPPTGLQITSATASQVVLVASAKDCTRVLTSTKGSTAAQQVRTITCVK